MARRTFAPDPTSVHAVRRFVTDAVSPRSDPGDAVLVASELATNAVLHARTDYEVTVDIDDERIRIAVSDDNPRDVIQVPSSTLATSGRGLGLVGRVSSHWGIDRVEDSGKVVWCELPVAGR